MNAPQLAELKGEIKRPTFSYPEVGEKNTVDGRQFYKIYDAKTVRHDFSLKAFGDCVHMRLGIRGARVDRNYVPLRRIARGDVLRSCST